MTPPMNYIRTIVLVENIIVLMKLFKIIENNIEIDRNDSKLDLISAVCDRWK
jgi:hypothetical protein